MIDEYKPETVDNVDVNDLLFVISILKIGIEYAEFAQSQIDPKTRLDRLTIQGINEDIRSMLESMGRLRAFV